MGAFGDGGELLTDGVAQFFVAHAGQGAEVELQLAVAADAVGVVAAVDAAQV